MSGFDVQMRSDAMTNQARMQGLGMEMQTDASMRQDIGQFGNAMQQQGQFEVAMALRERESQARMRLQEAEMERQQNLTKLADARALMEAEQHKTAMQSQKLALEAGRFELEQARKRATPDERAAEYERQFAGTKAGLQYLATQGKVMSGGRIVEDREAAKKYLSMDPEMRRTSVAEGQLELGKSADARADKKLTLDTRLAEKTLELKDWELEVGKERLTAMREEMTLRRELAQMEKEQFGQRFELDKFRAMTDRIGMLQQAHTRAWAVKQEGQHQNARLEEMRRESAADLQQRAVNNYLNIATKLTDPMRQMIGGGSERQLLQQAFQTLPPNVQQQMRSGLEATLNQLDELQVQNTRKQASAEGGEPKAAATEPFKATLGDVGAIHAGDHINGSMIAQNIQQANFDLRKVSGLFPAGGQAPGVEHLHHPGVKIAWYQKEGARIRAAIIDAVQRQQGVTLTEEEAHERVMADLKSNDATMIREMARFYASRAK